MVSIVYGVYSATNYTVRSIPTSKCSNIRYDIAHSTQFYHNNIISFQVTRVCITYIIILCVLVCVEYCIIIRGLYTDPIVVCGSGVVLCASGVTIISRGGSLQLKSSYANRAVWALLIMSYGLYIYCHATPRGNVLADAKYAIFIHTRTRRTYTYFNRTNAQTRTKTRMKLRKKHRPTYGTFLNNTS